MPASDKRIALLVNKAKYLPKILPNKELNIFKSLFAIFILSFLGVLLGLYLIVTEPAPQAGGSYIEGVVGRPRLINPLYAENNTADRDLVKLTYAGLVKFNGFELIPDLADKWEISPDQKTYTFYLRQGLTWPDSLPFTSNDVLFTIKTVQNPSYQSPLQASFAGITIEVLDEYAVKFTLPKPLTPFLESLSVGILPEHIWSQITPEAVGLTDFNIEPMGLGPYRFKRLTKDKFGNIYSYTLERNENYHLNKPYLKHITLRFYNDINGAIEGLKRHKVEGLSRLPQKLMGEVKLNNINIHSLQLPQYTAIFFNLSADSPVNNKSVRKALAMALNKNEILEQAINGEGQIINGPILPSYPGFNPDIEKFEFNVAGAKQELTEAGWKSVNGSRQNENNEELKIILTTANTPELIQAAEIIQRAWQEIGIIVELKIVDTSIIQNTIISPRNFKVLLFGEIVGLDPDPYAFWHSSQISSTGLNLSNFKHPEADQVLEEARETPNLKKKAEKYVHFQNILVAEIPAIFLYNPNYLYPLDKKIKGLTQARIINPSDRLANIHKWYIKTKRIFK